MNENEALLKHMHLVDVAVARLAPLMPTMDAAVMRSAGMGALLRAIRTCQKGEQPAIYYLRIRWAIYDEMRRHDVLSRRDRVKKKLIETTEEKLREELGRDPTENEIRERLKLSPKLFRLWRLNTSAKPPISINSSIFRHGRKHDLEAVIPDLRAKEAFDSEERERLLREAVDQLPTKFRRVIEWRFFTGLTHRQIGRKLGVTESRVSQMVGLGVGQLRTLIKNRYAQQTPNTASSPR